MSTAQLIVGQILWWWFIMGAVFMAVEWEYDREDSFLTSVSRNTIGTYGFLAGLVLNGGTVVGGLVVWPVVAFRRLPPRVRTAVSPSRLRLRRAGTPQDGQTTDDARDEGADDGTSGDAGSAAVAPGTGERV